MKAWIFVIFSLLTGFVSQVNGGYDVSVKLLEYYRDPDDCCDDFLGCAGECDVFFQICLKPLHPTQDQKCYGKDNNQRVENTNSFLFADSLKSADFYSWKDIQGQPSFDISVHVFDDDDLSSDDKIGVTTYEYRDCTTQKLTVTTTPGSKNLRIKLTLTVSCSVNYFGQQCDQGSKTTVVSTTTSKIPSTTTARLTSTQKRVFTSPTTPSTTTTMATTRITSKRAKHCRKTTNNTITTLRTFTCNNGTLTTIKDMRNVNGGYDVSVKLLEYYRDPDNCCDTVIGCAGECDVYFQICLKPLQPKQYQKCYGKNRNQRVRNTHNFLFADSLKSADLYTWKDIIGQPSFDISVHAFDFDDFSSDDELGVTTYEYRDYTTQKLTVTTNPGSKKLRIKLSLDVSSGQESVNTPIEKWLHLVVAVSAASLFCL